MKITKETWIIAFIGIADLVTTIVFIRHHGAQEANPLFRRCWDLGIPVFILAKLLCLVGPLMILEWARQHRPRFVSSALRTAIVGYLLFYGIGYFRLNGPQAAAAEMAPRSMNSQMLMYANQRWLYGRQYGGKNWLRFSHFPAQVAAMRHADWRIRWGARGRAGIWHVNRLHSADASCNLLSVKRFGSTPPQTKHNLSHVFPYLKGKARSMHQPRP